MAQLSQADDTRRSAKGANIVMKSVVQASHAAAPKARDMIARGKREARRPWIALEKGVEP